MLNIWLFFLSKSEPECAYKRDAYIKRQAYLTHTGRYTDEEACSNENVGFDCQPEAIHH